MRVVVPVVLAVLTLLDGCFSGFRAAAGRDARTNKGAYARAACAKGTVAGALVILLMAAYTLATVLLSSSRYDVYVRAGQHLLAVVLPYGALVLAALVGYVAIPRTGAQTLMSTLVLGPFTLARPLVVVVAAGYALSSTGDTLVRTGIVLAAMAVLAVEPILYRRPPPDVPTTPPSWAQSANAGRATSG
jgi:hypothetical protein